MPTLSRPIGLEFLAALLLSGQASVCASTQRARIVRQTPAGRTSRRAFLALRRRNTVRHDVVHLAAVETPGSSSALLATQGAHAHILDAQGFAHLRDALICGRAQGSVCLRRLPNGRPSVDHTSQPVIMEALHWCGCPSAHAAARWRTRLWSSSRGARYRRLRLLRRSAPASRCRSNSFLPGHQRIARPSKQTDACCMRGQAAQAHPHARPVKIAKAKNIRSASRLGSLTTRRER